MGFALRTFGLGYVALEKSYCIINIRRLMTVVNFDKTTTIIQRIMP